MENTKVRALIENLEKLIPVCLPPEEVERINDWTIALDSYRRSMTILWKKDGNYTLAEWREYQEHMGIFGNVWVKLHQQRGQTNYIHMGISGHIYKYMNEWGTCISSHNKGGNLLIH